MNSQQRDELMRLYEEAVSWARNQVGNDSGQAFWRCQYAAAAFKEYVNSLVSEDTNV